MTGPNTTRGDHLANLSPQQVAALETLLLTGSLARAAAAAEVTDRTLRRWRTTPAFRRAYAGEVRLLMAESRQNLQSAAGEAVQVLRSGLTRGSAASKARCARALVELALKVAEDDVDERLSELEREVATWHDGRPTLSVVDA